MKIPSKLLKEWGVIEEEVLDVVNEEEDFEKLIDKVPFGFLNWILSKILDKEEDKKYSIYCIERALFVFEKLFPEEDSLRLILEKIKLDIFEYDDVYFSFTKALNEVNREVVKNINLVWEKWGCLNIEDFQRDSEVNKYLGAANVCLAIETLIMSDTFGSSGEVNKHSSIIFKFISNALDYYITEYNKYWGKFEEVQGSASDIKKEILLYGLKLIEERE